MSLTTPTFSVPADASASLVARMKATVCPDNFTSLLFSRQELDKQFRRV